MNVIEAITNKDKVLQQNLSVVCDKCNEKYFSSFNRLYVLVQGTCYECDGNEIVAEILLNNV